MFNNTLKGILLKILATFLFTMMTVVMKLTSVSVTSPQLVFSRAFFALIPILGWMMWRGQFAHTMKTPRFLGHLWRGVLAVVSMFFGFTTLKMLPLADATAISYAMPLITVVLAATMLKEEVRASRWIAVFVGLIGVLIMLWPHLQHGLRFDDGQSALGALLALAGATCAGFAIVQMRQLTRTESTPTVVFYFTIITSFLSALTLPFAWNSVGGRDLLLLISTGILGGFAQIAITEGFRIAPASLLAPFQYTSMIWAVLFGLFLFGEPLHPLVMIGAVIVIGSGLFVIYREHKRGVLSKSGDVPPL